MANDINRKQLEKFLDCLITENQKEAYRAREIEGENSSKAFIASGAVIAFQCVQEYLEAPEGSFEECIKECRDGCHENL